MSLLLLFQSPPNNDAGAGGTIVKHRAGDELSGANFSRERFNEMMAAQEATADQDDEEALMLILSAL